MAKIAQAQTHSPRHLVENCHTSADRDSEANKMVLLSEMSTSTTDVCAIANAKAMQNMPPGKSVGPEGRPRKTMSVDYRLGLHCVMVVNTPHN
jgi:hypothetical protein